MKVYIKKDKVLKLLGEGKVYSKKDLVLREAQIAATTPNAKNVRQMVANSKQIFNQNANVPVVNAQLGQFDQQQDSQTGEGLSVELPANATSQQISRVQSMASKPENDDMTVTVTKPTTQSTSDSNLDLESAASKKIMDEMRENSIPFTKSELTKFLKSL